MRKKWFCALLMVLTLVSASSYCQTPAASAALARDLQSELRQISSTNKNMSSLQRAFLQTRNMEEVEIAREVRSLMEVAHEVLDHLSTLAELHAEMVNEQDRTLVRSHLRGLSKYALNQMDNIIDSLNTQLSFMKSPALALETQRLRDILQRIRPRLAALQ